jgi:hypothetical protein
MAVAIRHATEGMDLKPLLERPIQHTPGEGAMSVSALQRQCGPPPRIAPRALMGGARFRHLHNLLDWTAQGNRINNFASDFVRAANRREANNVVRARFPASVRVG